MHPMEGKQLGNYVIRRLLGEGGMGAVFLGEHAFLGDRAAIKVLHGTYAQNPSVTHRFFQEAKATREINHPNVVKILDFGKSDDGSLYLVMEFLDGESLSSRLAHGPLGEAEATGVAYAVAEALGAAHARGIVHRDIKPDNIYLLGTGGLKVVDFGIAKVLDSAANTGTGALMGTPAYMAPEQAKDSKSVSAVTDVYALGAVLFEMMTGRTPFIGNTLIEIITKLMLEAPPRPSAFVTISADREQLILQCLEKDPARRPQSMEEVQRRLGGPGDVLVPKIGPKKPTIAEAVLADGRKSTTLSGGAGELLAVSGAAKSPHPTMAIGGAASKLSGDASSKPTRRGRFISGAVIVSVAAAAAATVMLRGGTSPGKAQPPMATPTSAAAVAPKPEVVAARETVHLMINSDPAGATIVRASDKKVIGVTPKDLELDRAPGTTSFTLEREGYHHADVRLPTDRDGSVTTKLVPKPHTQVTPVSRPKQNAPGHLGDGTYDPFK